MKTLTILRATFVLLLVASSLPAVAGTVNMQFIAAGGNSYNGVSSYPYAATVNGSPFNAMCISYNEHITGGETWQANVYTVDQYAALTSDTMVVNRKPMNWHGCFSVPGQPAVPILALTPWPGISTSMFPVLT